MRHWLITTDHKNQFVVEADGLTQACWRAMNHLQPGEECISAIIYVGSIEPINKPKGWGTRQTSQPVEFENAELGDEG